MANHCLITSGKPVPHRLEPPLPLAILPQLIASVVLLGQSLKFNFVENCMCPSCLNVFQTFFNLFRLPK